MTTIIDYIWIDAWGSLRSKNRVVSGIVEDLIDVPEWNFDGSSTGQAPVSNSEIILQPVKISNCPFSRPGSKIVLCQCLNPDATPALNNHRSDAEKIFQQYECHESWFGLEQEYYLVDNYSDGIVSNGRHYCGVGDIQHKVRSVINAHLEACLNAGLNICGTNIEVGDCQAEFQIGIVGGIDAADQLWIARYLLLRIAEIHNYSVNFESKPCSDSSGSGCHVNFSTKTTRAPGGYQHIIDSIDSLQKTHDAYMKLTGIDNHLRMTGTHETSDYLIFSWGLSDRSASVRIPRETATNGCGYFEDRRPGANADPYLVTSHLMRDFVSEQEPNKN